MNKSHATLRPYFGLIIHLFNKSAVVSSASSITMRLRWSEGREIPNLIFLLGLLLIASELLDSGDRSLRPKMFEMG